MASGAEVKLVVRSQLGLAERLGVKAMDDCGPASLATAATYLGRDTSTKEAHGACATVGRKDTPTGAEGTSAAEVRDAAKVLGLRARIVYDWGQVTLRVKEGAALILNIQASEAVVDASIRSKWQRDYWRKNPRSSYGHYVVLVYSETGWEYACPTMREGNPGRALTIEQVRTLRDSKHKAGMMPAMIVISNKGEE